jgi:UDP-N-acetylmuramoyl-L-alanyl-D-glutamate--2,6-diaminopimelate ligase
MMAAAVAAMTLGELLGTAAGPHAGLTVTDLMSDSRQVTPGAAFVALEGERSHGLDFAAQAFDRGAAVVLHEPSARALGGPWPGVAVPGLRARLGELGRRFYGGRQPSRDLVGITGTNGKTTVAWLVAQALDGLGESCAYFGTLGYGRPGSLRPHELTTPDCLTLHRELAEVGTESAAVEVSSHALTQDRVAGLEFTVAAFTNLSRDHLDWHGSMEAYFEAKARLFERTGLKAAVVNAADAYGRVLLARLPPALRPIAVAVGSETGADIEVRLLSRSLSGCTLEVHAGTEPVRVASRLIGEFNAENLALALGVLVATGRDPHVAGAALSEAAPPPGRMEVFGGPPDRPWVVVDYAHTPQALERVLAELALIGDGEITCVVGCGGDRDRGKRALMGEVAARYSAHLILTDDNPRGEDPVAIVADIKAGIARHPDLRVEHARERAIGKAIAAARPGDVVLVAGKGHETAQQIGGVSKHLDDRAVVRRTLGGNS